MDFIRFAIDNPVKVSAGVLLVLLFGFLAFFAIPVQLTPNVDEPVITVSTQWIGASPQEVEREIIDRQEEKLKSVTGLKKMISTSQRDGGEIRLEFNVGVDKDAALRDTIEKVNQVGSYPEEVDRPQTVAADSASSSEIAWLIFRDHNGRDVSTMFDFVDDEILPRLERVDGVGSTDAYGGREREVQVQVDAARMAARGVTFRELEAALRRENVNTSAGTTDVGKRQYTYRTVGRYTNVADVDNTVIAYRAGGPVYVRDVAEVVKTHKKAYGFVKSHNHYCLAIPVRRETGANVMSTMEGVKAAVADLNQNLLEPRGMSLEQVYDETVYIHSAIDLVISNIYLGGFLATAVLLYYLRSVRATLVVILSIPISVVGTFLAVTLLGRSLNVVMLAGMAFAVGMVVDNAIVVLENIYRHRQMGESRAAAALNGAREVWGAILASTLTTAAVFIPVIFVKEEAGQLFRDIAIAIASAVMLSLIVSITVVPTLAARILKGTMQSDADAESGRFAQAVGRLVAWINSRTSTRLAVVVGLMVISLVGSYLLVPPASYLPSGNRNFVFGFLVPPPGYAMDEFHHMGDVIGKQMEPFWEADVGTPEAAALPEVPLTVGSGAEAKQVMVQAPPVQNFFYAVFQGAAIMGCFSKEEGRVKPLIPVLTQAGSQFPGCFTAFWQVPLFGRSFGSGDSVELELRCDNDEHLNQAAGALFAQLLQSPYGYAQPEPQSFNVGRPEIQAVVDRVKAADLQLNVADIGFTVGAAINGSYVGSFVDEGDEIDLVIKVAGMDRAARREVANLPISTPTGRIVPLSSVVDFQQKFEPQSIRHSESARSIKFNVNVPAGTALETGIEDLQTNFIAKMRTAGMMADDVIVTMEGNADKLKQTRQALTGSFAGLFERPRLFGWSPLTSTIALLGVVAALGGCLAVVVSGRVGFGVLTIGAALVLLAVLGMNTALAVELLQSRAFLALLVTYLLMAALFESFVYPIVIMLSVPLALVGGFLGLAITHAITLR
ncbi:MAG TPA: efflux RND transporter permease subunit, partial [Phycisphaerae bacterium]|nr:efflux RND transporter permease subunit [Phycisphaerae bacterium]